MPYPNTTFPITLDNQTNINASNFLDISDHAGLHTFENNAIKAIETKVGINSSSDNTSIDYKLQTITGTNKSLSSDLSNVVNSSDIIKGIAKLSVNSSGVAFGVNDNKIPTIDTSTFNQGMLDAMAGSYGTPSNVNTFVTSKDTAFNTMILTTDQTIAGIKTFSSIPVLPGNPTTSNQLSNKAYIDSL